MSGFWDSSLGEISGRPEDAFAKSFTHIPDGTMALARIDAIVNAEYEGNKYISIDWYLTEGDFRGSKVNQKLKVYGGDNRDKDPEKTRHRALNMLKLLYQLYNIKPKHTNAPSDDDLAIFANKIAGIKIRETEPNAEGKQYNWVAEVHKSEGFKCETGIKLEVVHTRTNLDSAFSRNPKGQDQDLEDDIPFN